MPGRGTPHWGIRAPEELWTEFGEAAERAGTDRSSVLREFIRWYTRRSELFPQRPATAPKRKP